MPKKRPAAQIMEINQQAIQDAIVAQAVDHFTNDDDIYGRVKAAIEARIENVFTNNVAGLITAKVEEITKEGFEREYRKHDAFGRPVGEPTSISKELEKLVANYWTQKVDRAGKVTTDSYNAVSRAEWMMAKICADDFSKELQQHVINVAGSLKDHFRGVLNNHIAIMLSDVFKVQSQGDREIGKPGMSSISPPAKPIGS